MIPATRSNFQSRSLSCFTVGPSTLRTILVCTRRQCNPASILPAGEDCGTVLSCHDYRFRWWRGCVGKQVLRLCMLISGSWDSTSIGWTGPVQLVVQLLLAGSVRAISQSERPRPGQIEVIKGLDNSSFPSESSSVASSARPSC